MTEIHNPVLRGFHPDPCVCVVGKNIYVATSTFEWFPGVRLHQTQDLVNWKTLPYPLTRLSQLNLAGNPSSGGVWAPALSYADGIFYLIYTDVKTWKGRFNCPAHDHHNWLVTAPDITGPWSDPVFLNSSGFDPSLFHDTDGRKWLVNMEWDYRAIDHHPGNEQDTTREEFSRYFGGILLQEYSAEKQQLVGDVHRIFTGTELGFTEGPHLYRWHDKYYLLTAEGGTSYEHAATLARSDNLLGPYELHPHNPLLSADGFPKLPLQKTGHGSICQTSAGDWLLFHLCGRPLTEKGACPLGRETAVQPLEWKDDGWLYIRGGDNKPLEKFTLGGAASPQGEQGEQERSDHETDFSQSTLDLNFQSLRIPITEDWCSLKSGSLRLYGQEGFSSQFRQSIIARRQQDFCYKVRTRLSCNPENFQQMAGLIVRYDEENQYYLRISHDEKLGRVLGIIAFNQGKFDMPLGRDGEVPLPATGSVLLQVICVRDKLQFYYSASTKEEQGEGEQQPAPKEIGKTLPADILSDEHAYPMGFTGAFVGMACHDMSGKRMPADFDYFSYNEGQYTFKPASND